MVLTVVVGSSGSGKTTFLEEVHKINNSVYVRQYHTLRPYIPVCMIPNFDPTRLPFWSLYSQKEALDGSGEKNASYNPKVKIGGTMAGEFHAGLSGGQRKMMLFEMVCQRVANSSALLVCLDEPFAGVTDDFVPFIVERLNELRTSHNVLLVTNDHVSKLTEMADSIITVSAIDRSKVQVGGKQYKRETVLHAVSSGKHYEHVAGHQDLWFFLNTEVISNPQILGVACFTIFSMLLFLATFWDSKPGSEPLVLVAIQIICFFTLNPYLVGLTDWRNTMKEEAEALMHFSVQTNLALKACVVMTMLIAVSALAFGMLNACIHTLGSAEYWLFMLFDSASMTLPFICFGLYSSLPLQIVEIVAALPFLFMIFFSTTFSPGAGVGGVKMLRFLFSRFYFWCKVPGVAETMQGCPPDEWLVFFAVLTGCLPLILFGTFQFVRVRVGGRRQVVRLQGRRESTTSTSEFARLQEELYRNMKDSEKDSIATPPTIKIASGSADSSV
jgi:ABC-type nitrate/sulfonate/bicarbonate transport system ATPase subunit